MNYCLKYIHCTLIDLLTDGKYSSHTTALIMQLMSISNVLYVQLEMKNGYFCQPRGLRAAIVSEYLKWRSP